MRSSKKAVSTLLETFNNQQTCIGATTPDGQESNTMKTFNCTIVPAPGRPIGGITVANNPLTQTDRAILNAVMAAPDAHSALLAVVELFRAEDSLSH